MAGRAWFIVSKHIVITASQFRIYVGSITTCIDLDYRVIAAFSAKSNGQRAARRAMDRDRSTAQLSEQPPIYNSDESARNNRRAKTHWSLGVRGMHYRSRDMAICAFIGVRRAAVVLVACRSPQRPYGSGIQLTVE